MDIMLLGEKTLRVKGKNSSAVINPTSTIGKTEADAILELEKYPDSTDSKVTGTRIIINGPGEYEVGGMKYSVVGVSGKLVTKIDTDSLKLLVGSGEVIEKFQDKVENCDIAVINADSGFNYSVLTSLEPRVLIVYGDKKDEVAKSLGKSSEKITKFSTTQDKLPSEMQFVLLG